MSRSSPEKLLSGYCSGTDHAYGFLSTLEASTAILAHYVRSGERLFSDASPTSYTRCKDLLRLFGNYYPPLVGCFGSSGLAITSTYCDHVFGSHGVSVCRKLATLPAQSFGPALWRKHFGVAVDGHIPSLPSDIDAILDGPCPFWPTQKVRDTHVLVLVPSEVDGAPFTLNKLGELIRSWFPDNEEGYGSYPEPVSVHLGDRVSPKAPYWVLMTRFVLPESQDMSYRLQDDLLKTHAVKTPSLDYGLPSALEASTAILAHYVRSKERLFSDAPPTYTRCKDLAGWSNGKSPVFVGNFGSSGLHFNSRSNDGCGVSVCRKFF